MFSLKTSSLRSATVFQQLTAIKIDTDSSLTDQIVKKGVSVRRLCVDNFLLPLTVRLRGWGLLLPASIDICMLYTTVYLSTGIMVPAASWFSTQEKCFLSCFQFHLGCFRVLSDSFSGQQHTNNLQQH